MNLKRLLRSISRPSPLGFSGDILITLIACTALYSAAAELIKTGVPINLANASEKTRAAGLVAIIAISVHSLARAVYNLIWKETRVLASLGRPRLGRDFSGADMELYIVGQNLKSSLSNRGIKPHLIDMLSKEAGPTIYIIGATYEGMKAISDECALHFLDTLVDIMEIYVQGRWAMKRLVVRFSRDAISLSCIITDPKSTDGTLLLSSKWATDEEPDNRLHFFIENWEHPEIFGKIVGRCGRLVQSDSNTLKEICRKIKRDKKVTLTPRQAFAFDYFESHELT